MSGYFKFGTGQTKYYGHIKSKSDNIITLEFDGTIPQKATVSGKGATWYNGGDFPMGDYAEFTTPYRWHGGIYQLSNDGSTYIPPEPVPEPEPYMPTPTEIRIAELNAIIAENKSLLAESDYKVIKNSEYAEAGLEVAYEPSEVNAERQAYRDAINVAETELATLFESEVS